MSLTKTEHNLPDIKNGTKPQACNEGDVKINEAENRRFTVTTSQTPSSGEEETTLCSGQKSFISIHSTDHLCQVESGNQPSIEECNVKVLSINDVFPSTSEESLTNDDDTQVPKQRRVEEKMPKASGSRPTSSGNNSKLNQSKSTTVSGSQKEAMRQPPAYSDFDIPNSTLYVVGSNPGEPKMSYPDVPKKVSKTMKKFLRTMDKHKNDGSAKSTEKKTLGKFTAMRGILKDNRCVAECTGDSTAQPTEESNAQSIALPFALDFNQQNYSKQQDKNVTFNTQVVIIHFRGDLCVGQSVEALSKEKDQQARNSELRKTFLSKYNEFWHTQKQR